MDCMKGLDMCTGVDDTSMRCRVCKNLMSKALLPIRGHFESAVQCGATLEQLGNSTVQSCRSMAKSFSESDWWCQDFADGLALSLSTATETTNLTAICEQHGEFSVQSPSGMSTPQ